jgi:D-alanyl-D-alanine carboxypeptidase (penicillin-binding protein 5/6)
MSVLFTSGSFCSELIPRQGVALRVLAIIILVTGGQVLTTSVRAQETFETAAQFAILLDSRSGKVYYEKQADELMSPASMSKIMTMLMVFERLKDGRLKMDDEFVISEDAWRRGGAASGGSTMYAELNSRVKLRDLIRGVTIQSANDACIAIAEGIAGSEQAFAELMTKRARELGLEKSTFRNSTGLPDPQHRMTARELATLARYLIEVFPQFYKYYSEREFTWNNIRQHNRNPLLGSFPGADGIKTGYIREAGYGLVGSAQRNGRRLIVVLNGMRSRKERAAEAKKILEWGFRKFRDINVYEAGEKVSRARVWGGERTWVSLVTKERVNVLLAPEERDGARAEAVYEGPIQAPVRKGQQIGKLRLTVDGKTVSTQPLFAGEAVDEGQSMWRKAFDTVSFMILGG